MTPAQTPAEHKLISAAEEAKRLAAMLSDAEARGFARGIEAMIALHRQMATGAPVGAGDGHTYTLREVHPVAFEKAGRALSPAQTQEDGDG